MIVVCKKNPYNSRGFHVDMSELTVDKKYEVIQSKRIAEDHVKGYTLDPDYIQIISDKGIARWYEYDYFLTIQESREEKLKQLDI